MANAQHATLLVSCPDRRGIVAALAQLLYGHGANIVHSAQHSDEVSGDFFQRIVFDLSELHTDRVSLEAGVREVAQRFEMNWRIAYPEQTKRLALFVSKYEHCLLDLLFRHKWGELDCEIPLIVSNHPDLAEHGASFGIPYEHVPVTKATKPQAEQRQLELLAAHDIDVVVMARYMQILSDDFLASFPTVINIHHSFLPAFIGGKPYHQAHRRGVKLIGATAHYATADLDEGPIIEQDVIRTSHADAPHDLVRKGRDVEKAVLARAVRWHLEDRVIVHGNKTVVFKD